MFAFWLGRKELELLIEENKVELRKLRETVESLEQGRSSDLIDIWFFIQNSFLYV